MTAKSRNVLKMAQADIRKVLRANIGKLVGIRFDIPGENERMMITGGDFPCDAWRTLRVDKVGRLTFTGRVWGHGETCEGVWPTAMLAEAMDARAFAERMVREYDVNNTNLTRLTGSSALDGNRDLVRAAGLDLKAIYEERRRRGNISFF